MITGVIKNKVDKIWTDLWAGGITNPLTVIEQMTYLMFIRSLDEKELETEEFEHMTGEQMDKMFAATIEAFKQYGIGVEVEVLGNRPCSADFDNSPLTNKIKAIAAKHGNDMHEHAGSTDCNVWLAKSVPAVCFGVYEGQGAHTREEWISISSMDIGKKIFAEVVLSYFDEQ